MSNRFGKTGLGLAAVLASALILPAQQPAVGPSGPGGSAAPGVVRMAGEAFRAKTFHFGSLGLKFEYMSGNFFTIRIFNDSDGFMVFNPGDLLIASAGSTLQVLEVVGIGDTQPREPAPLRLAPRTFALLSLRAFGNWQVPYKVYFQKEVFAEVSD